MDRKDRGITIGLCFYRSSLGFGGLLLVGLLIGSVQAQRQSFSPQESVGTDCRRPPALNPELFPSEVLPLLDQTEVNCFAWQEFLSLNWIASSEKRGKPDVGTGSSEFGQPGDLRPLVWQTYKNVEEVFLPGAKVPSPWEQRGDGDALDQCRSLVSREKFHLSLLHETNQAGVPPPSWLVGQNGKKVFFEIYINRDMFEFILEHKFYNAQHQYLAVQDGGPGINAPAGRTRYGHEGAVEIKAAWIEIDDPALWSRFKMSDAIVYDPTTSSPCRKVRVGLVGLHIIHKTPTAPQWIWATFEQVDNAPDHRDVHSRQFRPYYTFYNPRCGPPSSPACEVNRKPVCDTSNACTPFHPIQVVRETPLAQEVRSLNARVHQAIRSANPDSVWQYYDLVNVMWPGSSQPIRAGAKVPLANGGVQPTILANTVIETYVQTGAGKKNCLDCHAYAAIAPTVSDPSPRWGADYSFVFAKACDPTLLAEQCHPTVKGK
ncbi:MAG: hypothetical protein AB7G75_17405 [Candidatus Binatia bacterium]